MRTERAANELRPIKIEPGFSRHNASVVFHIGNTIVNCTASVSDRPPSFVPEGEGWITAEYAMLPGSTTSRVSRDRGRKISGRTMEIQRLIGRSLRGVANFAALGPRSIQIDCDILNADGGTRCASITAAYIVLHQTLAKLEAQGELKASDVMRSEVAAVSVGFVEGQLLLDLQYTEDHKAEVDLNLIMTGDQKIIEVQGTAEGKVFTQEQLNQMIEVGSQGVAKLVEQTRKYLQTNPLPTHG